MNSIENKLDFCTKHNLNVLLRGRHGTGKTHMVQNILNQNNIKWLYFSASTMDPWVDFVGVPKEKINEDGTSYLDLIRPEVFATDQVEAIFFDELNRAPKKVRNAVMELIQFKSINGKKFNNLRFVWGAINPENENEDNSENEYDIEKLDPAQLDRFHIIIDVDNKPNRSYFATTYGEEGNIAIDWWNSLDTKFKLLVSPRRLDYVIKVFKLGGDISDTLPKEINTHQLLIQLQNGSFISKLKSAYKNDSEAIKLISDINSFDNIIDTILKNKKYTEYFSQFFPEEKINDLIITNDTFRKFVTKDKESIEKFKNNIVDIIKADKCSKSLKKELKLALPDDNLLLLTFFLNKYQNPRLYETTVQRVSILNTLANLTNISTANKEEIIDIFSLAALCFIRSNSTKTYLYLENILEKIFLNMNSQPNGLTFDEIYNQSLTSKSKISKYFQSFRKSGNKQNIFETAFKAIRQSLFNKYATLNSL